MPTILLLTAESLPHDDHETASVATALDALGVDSTIVPWSAAGLSSIPAELAVIRSCWGYTVRLAEFLAVLESLPSPVRNSVQVVRWNCHKGYLLELADSGVPVLPTELFRCSDPVPETVPDFDAVEVIVKPAVSAGAVGVGRFAAGSQAALAHLRSILADGDALVQPFRPEIAAGERSIIFLDGKYSHAVLKTPVSGEFRVQERFGGRNRPHDATPGELDAAVKALAVVPTTEPLLYARVDLVGDESAPLVMELELIEPELFLPQAPGSAQRLASALARSIRPGA